MAGGTTCPTGIGGGGGGIGILESKVAERSQFGARCARFARLGAALGFQALEFLQGAVVGALGGIDAALEAAKGVCAAAKGLACRAVLFRGPGILGFAFEDFSIDSAKAAEQPLILDEDVDEEALLGGGWLPAFPVLLDEVLEFDGVLAGDDLRFGVNADFGGVEAETALPSGERGPVDFCALRRFAWICWMVAIKEKDRRAQRAGRPVPLTG